MYVIIIHTEALIIHCSLAASNIPSCSEPSGLHRSDGKRSDGMSMVSWLQGKFLVWEATCADTLCASNLEQAFNLHLFISEAGNAAAHAEVHKTCKYTQLGLSYRICSFQSEFYLGRGRGGGEPWVWFPP